MKARNASTQIKNRPFSFSCSFPSTPPNGTLARPNNGILNVNLLDDGFNAVVCSRGGLFRGVCWSCAEGGVVGSDGTLSSTEHGDGSARLFDEREAVYTGGRSVNTTSTVGDCAVGSCWRCVAAVTLRGYVGGGVDGMTSWGRRWRRR